MLSLSASVELIVWGLRLVVWAVFLAKVYRDAAWT